MRKPLALVAALLVPLAFALPAKAFVYWSTFDGAIGRANLDGTRNFIRTKRWPGGLVIGPGRR